MRILVGVGEASYAVLAPTLIGDLFPRSRRNLCPDDLLPGHPDRRGPGYGLAGMNAGLGSRQAAFRVVGLPGLAVAFAALALREAGPRGQRPGRRGAGALAGARLAACPPAITGACWRNRSYVPERWAWR